MNCVLRTGLTGFCRICSAGQLAILLICAICGEHEVENTVRRLRTANIIARETRESRKKMIWIWNSGNQVGGGSETIPSGFPDFQMKIHSAGRVSIREIRGKKVWSAAACRRFCSRGLPRRTVWSCGVSFSIPAGVASPALWPDKVLWRSVDDEAWDEESDEVWRSANRCGRYGRTHSTAVSDDCSFSHFVAHFVVYASSHRFIDRLSGNHAKSAAKKFGVRRLAAAFCSRGLPRRTGWSCGVSFSIPAGGASPARQSATKVAHSKLFVSPITRHLPSVVLDCHITFASQQFYHLCGDHSLIDCLQAAVYKSSISIADPATN